MTVLLYFSCLVLWLQNLSPPIHINAWRKPKNSWAHSSFPLSNQCSQYIQPQSTNVCKRNSEQSPIFYVKTWKFPPMFTEFFDCSVPSQYFFYLVFPESSFLLVVILYEHTRLFISFYTTKTFSHFGARENWTLKPTYPNYRRSSINSVI